MTLDEIKTAVERGEAVHWANTGYRVVKDSIGQWLIECDFNRSCIGLTWADETTLNGREDQFFIAPQRLIAWQEDANYPVSDWQEEVAADDTRLGYIEWRNHQIEMNR